jgi:hypothetical protein
MALEDSVTHALGMPYVCRYTSEGPKYYDIAAITKKDHKLKGRWGTFDVTLGVSSMFGLEIEIQFKASLFKHRRYYFIQVVRTSDGTGWAHGKDNALTRSEDVYPRTDPRSGYRVDNRQEYPFFSQHEPAVPDFIDLKPVGCTVGGWWGAAIMRDGPAGFFTVSDRKLAENNEASFFRFEAITSVMDLESKDIIESLEWAFDVRFRHPWSSPANTALCVYEPQLMRTLLASPKNEVREAANARFVARNECFAFWNEYVDEKVRQVPGTLANWAADGSNLI